jgi:hypothetical protein
MGRIFPKRELNKPLDEDKKSPLHEFCGIIALFIISSGMAWELLIVKVAGSM